MSGVALNGRSWDAAAGCSDVGRAGIWRAGAGLCRRRFCVAAAATIATAGRFRPARAASAWPTREGRFLRLVTDLPDAAELDDYTAAFDAAVPQWAAYFDQPLTKLRHWRATAYLMSAKQPFVDAGYLPVDLPDFQFGFQLGDRLWVLHQPTRYYTRHLLLHEGVHSLTRQLFGGSGPAWYMEGMAEYLATHQLPMRPRSGSEPPDGADNTAAVTPDHQAMRVGVIPQSSDAARGWSRIEVLAQQRRDNQVPRLETVMRYPGTVMGDVDKYAWSWLAVTLLEMYPQYREVLRRAARRGRDASPRFTREIFLRLREQWSELSARWWLLSEDIEYGFDAARSRVEFPNPLVPLDDSPVHFELDTARGWQALPVRVPAGRQLRIRAEGMYTIRQDAPPSSGRQGADQAETVRRPWQATADGVTIHYHRGRRLGRLLACALPLAMDDQRPQLPALQIEDIGSLGTIRAEADSWLLLKVNKPSGQLADNDGLLTIEVS